MDKIRSFKDLDAWKESHKLVLMIYKVTNNFPETEKFGLVSQMRRCSVSITSNIAEGFSRESNKEKTHFYYIAQGSVTELQNQLLVSRDVEYITANDFDKVDSRLTVAHKIINGLIKYAKNH